MKYPTLKELPQSPKNKTGWPWTEVSQCLDSTKISKAVGWMDAIPLEEGLKKTWDWWKEHWEKL